MLKNNVGNEEATMMLAQILCQQQQFSSALTHVKAWLQQHPKHWDALGRNGLTTRPYPFQFVL
jgi:hypothetical protein